MNASDKAPSTLIQLNELAVNIFISTLCIAAYDDVRTNIVGCMKFFLAFLLFVHTDKDTQAFTCARRSSNNAQIMYVLIDSHSHLCNMHMRGMKWKQKKTKQLVVPVVKCEPIVHRKRNLSVHFYRLFLAYDTLCPFDYIELKSAI